MFDVEIAILVIEWNVAESKDSFILSCELESWKDHSSLKGNYRCDRGDRREKFKTYPIHSLTDVCKTTS